MGIEIYPKQTPTPCSSCDISARSQEIKAGWSWIETLIKDFEWQLPKNVAKDDALDPEAINRGVSE